MGRKVSELTLVTSIGQNNEFVIKQGVNTKRVQYSTIVAQVSDIAKAQGSIAGSDAARITASAVAQDIASTALASVSNIAYDAAIAVYASLEERVSALESSSFATSAYVDSEIASVSAVLQSHISVNTVEIAANVSKIAVVSATLRDDITSIDPTWVHVSSLNSGDKRLQDYINDTGTTGIITGGDMSSVGPGLVYCSAARFFVRNANAPNAQIMFASIAGVSVSVVDGAANFLYASYNAGTPQWIQSPTPLADVYQNVIVGVAYRDGNSLHLSNVNVPPGQVGQKLARRLALVNGVTRQSGLVTAETGTRNISLTAGVVWLALTTYSLAAFDSSGADRFSYFYSDGSGGFTEVTSQATIDNTQYDDGSGTLATLSNNQYGVHWVYKTIDGETLVVYGTDTYTLNEAETATTPASLPLQITGLHAILCSKIIIKKSEATFTDIESAFDTVFSPGVASNHGDLGGLQGGTVDEYYHLTSAQLTEYTSITAVVSKQTLAITSVQAMVSKSDVKQTSVASQSDGIATAMLEAIVASTANTSTYGYRVSAENGIRTDKSGTPGNGQLLFALDFGTLTCVGNVGQDSHMPHWDSLGKEQLCPVSSLAHKFTSIASGVTRDDAGQIISGGALVSVYNIGDVSTGTHTLDYGLRPMQAYKNKGAHTLAPDTQTGYITLIIKSSTGAGAITTTGWSLVDGDAFETSSGGHFICYAQTTEAQSGTNKSHLNVKII